MKRWWMFFLLALLVATTVSCQTDLSTSEQTLTGTYFLWRQRVLDHFDAIDFSAFEFVYAREYTSAETPEAYVVLAVDGDAVKQEVLAMFDTFDGTTMFPSHMTDWAKFVLVFESATESMTLTFVHRASNDGVISFLHANADGLIESQSYTYSAFPEEVMALLSLFAIEQEMAYEPHR